MGLQRVPVNRSILTSDDTLMAIDRPGITGYNLTRGLRGSVEFDTAYLRNTNSGIWGPYHDRDLGATLFGAFSLSDMLHFKYYGGIYRGVQKIDDNDDNPRFAGRIQTILFDLRFWTVLLALFVFAGNVHADEKYPLFNNIVEDFKYLTTSPTRLDAKSALLTLGAVGVGVGLYFADENIRDFFQDHQNSFFDGLAPFAEKPGY
jgi:hypothetical protein